MSFKPIVFPTAREVFFGTYPQYDQKLCEALCVLNSAAEGNGNENSTIVAADRVRQIAQEVSGRTGERAEAILMRNWMLFKEGHLPLFQVEDVCASAETIVTGIATTKLTTPHGGSEYPFVLDKPSSKQLADHVFACLLLCTTWATAGEDDPERQAELRESARAFAKYLLGRGAFSSAEELAEDVRGDVSSTWTVSGNEPPSNLDRVIAEFILEVRPKAEPRQQGIAVDGNS